LRVDKLTYAALEGTLLEHLSEETSSIPVERMLGFRPEELMRRCGEVAEGIYSSQLVLDIVPVASLVGGGTAPKATLQSCAISLWHKSFPAVELLSRLRKLEPPIIGRISDDTVLLDLRTVPPDFDLELASLLTSL
jgi:L-seryl-tRNA(Ser) seleniumtransferase